MILGFYPEGPHSTLEMLIDLRSLFLRVVSGFAVFLCPQYVNGTFMLLCAELTANLHRKDRLHDFKTIKSLGLNINYDPD